MKYGNDFYIELTRHIFTKSYNDLSYKAKWLYVVLNELEHRYTGDNENFFYRSNDDLSKDTGLSLSALKRAKKELEQTDLIQTWLMHWIDPEIGKKSKRKITAYRILK